MWNATQKLTRTNSIQKESISLHKKAIANEVKSYSVIYDCFVTERGLCSPDEFKQNLLTLEGEADEIYSRISLLADDLE